MADVRRGRPEKKKNQFLHPPWCHWTWWWRRVWRRQRPLRRWGPWRHQGTTPIGALRQRKRAQSVRQLNQCESELRVNYTCVTLFLYLQDNFNSLQYCIVNFCSLNDDWRYIFILWFLSYCAVQASVFEHDLIQSCPRNDERSFKAFRKLWRQKVFHNAITLPVCSVTSG